MEEGKSKPKPKYYFETGDEVRVIDGPFEDVRGVIDEVKPDKLKVLINVSGPPTPVELDFIQVDKI